MAGPIGVDVLSAQQLTVTGTSAKFTNAMVPDAQYYVRCTVDAWVTIGATGGAAVADAAANVLLGAGTWMALRNEAEVTTNAFVHLIREGTVSGKATLVRVNPA